MKKLYFIFFFCISFLSAQDSVKIMLFGDSITELDWQGGYRAFLYDSLANDAGYVFNFVGARTTNHNSPNTRGFTFPESMWEHEGVTGRTALTWLNTVTAVITANTPKLMIVQIGTNDASNGSYSSITIKNNIGKLLDSIWNVSPTIRIVFSNIPRIYSTGSLWSQAKEDTIEQTNLLLPTLVAEKVSAGKKIVMVDQYSALALESDFTGDGVHPSISGYLRMRNAYYPYVVTYLNEILALKYVPWRR